MLPVVHDPQVFPTAVRTVAVGTVTSFARIGGALAPLLCSALIDRPDASLLLCAAIALVSAVVVSQFPHDTAGRPLTDAV
jgi:hypothetical protein